MVRALWLTGGLVAVGLGGVGVVIPGLPTTVFFIIAAACFARSSPRMEAWVLGLPKIGPLVADHRAGLGMRRRAKIIAITTITVACGLSAGLAIDAWAWRAVVLAAGLAGIAYLTWRVPTRERVGAPQSEVATTPGPP